ncbi:MAG TPA: lipid II flippase MurJ [Streptosporangiaceae bacterium]|nr:lipid II flippase MurJ [Streptosporangiaceae bacterium]
MTGPAVPVTTDGQDPGSYRPAGSGIGRAALLIAVLTVLARLLGLVRTLVFAKTVGATCLGTAYTTANTLPNIIYDIVLGGALTSIMVPVLARPAARSADDPVAAAEVRQTSSALLTWTALILAPVSLVIALAAGPLGRLLNPVNPTRHCARAPLVAVTGHMLAVFAPQILLYGLAVVLYGMLQAHRRFAGPALAPLVSSLVVIAAYLAFVPLGRADVNRLTALPRSAELVLAVGTTAGVAALALTALVPAWRLHVRVRPTLRFPAGVGRRAGGLAAFGIVALVAQDAAQLVVILLANGNGPNAAIVLYQYGWQLFEAAYAVLAISIAVSAFPALSVREGERFDQTASGALRAVLLMSFLGTALVLAVAGPAAHFLASSHSQIAPLARGFALFAPGLAGYGMVACLSRVLLADRRTRAAVIPVGGGWLIVIAADVVLVALAPGPWVVGMLALGNTIGLTAAGLALAVAVRRTRGMAALAGSRRVAVSGLIAALAGAVAGGGAAAALRPSGPVADALTAVLAALLAAAVFAAVAYVLDKAEVRAVAARIRAGALR